MNNFALFDKNFNIAYSGKYHLSIQLSCYDYSYCILDTATNTYVVLKSTNFDVMLNNFILIDKTREYFQQDDFLNRTYKSVAFVYIDKKATLVPDKYFDTKKLRSYMELTHSIDYVDDLCFNKLHKLQANIIFTIPANFRQFIESRFSGVRFFHQATPLIENSLNPVSWIGYKINALNVDILVHRNFFDIVVSDSVRLICFNTYSYKSENDFVYFVSFTIQKLELNIENVTVNLYGDISTESKAIMLLKKFVPNIRRGLMSDNFKNSSSFQKIKIHYLANLQNLYQCVSLEENIRAN